MLVRICDSVNKLRERLCQGLQIEDETLSSFENQRGNRLEPDAQKVLACESTFQEADKRPVAVTKPQTKFVC